MSLAVTPSPLPLVPALAQLPSMPNDMNRLLAAQRLALLGYSRQINSPPISSATIANALSIQALKATMQSSLDSSFTNSSTNLQPPSQSAVSSVARRKQRIANNSVASYALGITPDTVHSSPPPSSSNNDSPSSQSSHTIPNQPDLAPVGVVDMRFLVRQPPTVQKPLVEKQPKSVSKESSVGTPTSPSAPLAAAAAVPAPKNQRPKPARVAPAAATNGKSNSSTATASNGGNKSDTVDKDALKSKHAFLFRPESEQPSSGPYVRYSPMYHYYHPYRNLHRQAIKDEWNRLHPIAERIPPPEEEEVATPPRRTSGRQKKTNVRGVAARGRSDKSKKGAATAAATASQTNDATPASPLLANGRRSRANAGRSKNGGAKTAAKKGGRVTGNAANKRKRAEIEEEDKQIGGNDEAIPAPPIKRPRRGAAAAAALATEAAREAEEAGSNKDEGSPNEAQDDGEPKTTVKRRMRPNARKTAAARAAAMEAKVSHTSQQLLRNDNRDTAKQKQKKRSTEDGESVEDNGDEEGALESLKDDESVSKPDESQPAETPGADLDVPAGVDKDEALVDTELQAEPDAEQDVEPGRKTKAARGKGGFGAAKGPRAKTKRGGFGAQKRAPALTINTRGTPRGTPKQDPIDDETGSMPPDQDEAQIQNAPVGRRNTRKAAPSEPGPSITGNPPAKSRRAVGGGRKSRQDVSTLAQVQDPNGTSQEDTIVVDPLLIAEDAMSVSQHTAGDVEPDVAVADEVPMITDSMIATKLE